LCHRANLKVWRRRTGFWPENGGKNFVNLNGLKFETDLAAGHKTGMYLDQQANYQAVSQFAKGGNVLDCFSFLVARFACARAARARC